MTTNQNLAKGITNKAEWLEEAASFLEGKTALELYDIYLVLSRVAYGEEIRDRFVSAMRALFTSNVALALETSNLLLEAKEGALREEVYWILSSVMFTVPEAMVMIWDQLLTDPDNVVFVRTYEYAKDGFYDAENAPLSGLVYAARRLAEHKSRFNTVLPQIPR
jgi:hypothetical protein